jgi:hypothetical protein
MDWKAICYAWIMNRTGGTLECPPLNAFWPGLFTLYIMYLYTSFLAFIQEAWVYGLYCLVLFPFYRTCPHKSHVCWNDLKMLNRVISVFYFFSLPDVETFIHFYNVWYWTYEALMYKLVAISNRCLFYPDHPEHNLFVLFSSSSSWSLYRVSQKECRRALSLVSSHLGELIIWLDFCLLGNFCFS